MERKILKNLYSITPWSTKEITWKSTIENDHDANTKRSFYLKFQTNQKEMICGCKRENVTKFVSMIDSYLP